MMPEFAAQPYQHLTIIGLGLIGGSLAMAARQAYPDLWIQGVDVSADSLQYALKAGTIDKASLTIPDSFADNHLIVLAAHLSDNLALLKAIAPRVAGQDIQVSDIGSCKREIYDLGQTQLGEQFIAGHPMAGKEFSGVQHATALLFAGKPYLLCPAPDLEATRLERLTGFLRGLGALPRTLTPEQHDRYMAYVSHVPQLYSILLANLLNRHEPGHLMAYQGGGLEGQLRLAASPYPMWRDIFIQNQDNIRSALNDLGHLVQQASHDLDTPAMADWFTRANHLHQEFHEFRLS